MQFKTMVEAIKRQSDDNVDATLKKCDKVITTKYNDKAIGELAKVANDVVHTKEKDFMNICIINKSNDEISQIRDILKKFKLEEL
jgi:hypothetical protein